MIEISIYCHSHRIIKENVAKPSLINQSNTQTYKNKAFVIVLSSRMHYHDQVQAVSNIIIL